MQKEGNSNKTQTYQHNQETLKRINGKVRQIQKMYQMALYNAFNLELIHKFNLQLYGEDSERYICPEKHAQRDSILRHVWDASFAHYGFNGCWDQKEV